VRTGARELSLSLYLIISVPPSLSVSLALYLSHRMSLYICDRRCEDALLRGRMQQQRRRERRASYNSQKSVNFTEKRQHHDF